MWYVIFITSLLFFVGNGDSIYFPDDRQVYNQAIIRGPPEVGNGYDSYVDDVISQGVTNLCLSLDRAVTEANKATPNDFFVYSPLSIASALALVLLGSNGKTFEEISTLLGLAHGINIHSNSQAVHEHFGNLINKLETSIGNNQLIKSATAVFVQNDFPIREQFKRASMNVYGSEVMNLDFKRSANRAQSVINGWVAGKTNGKIQNILAYEPPYDTKFIIVSTLYFKGDWEKPFTSEITSRRPFYSNGKNQPSTTEAMFMANGGEFPYYNDPTLDCEIFGLPYKGNTITFYVVIPNRSNKERLRELENRLNSNEIQRLASSTLPTSLILLFPKMKLTTTLQLNDELKYLGLKSLFDPSDANLALLSPGINTNIIKNEFENIGYAKNQGFGTNQPIIFAAKMKDCTNNTDCENSEDSFNHSSRIIKRQIQYRLEDSLDFIRNSINKNSQYVNPGLYADQVLHKVFIDITESGTEAASATSISLTRDGSRKNIKTDVPFFFFIRHEQTKLVLFWGSVNTPAPNFT